MFKIFKSIILAAIAILAFQRVSFANPPIMIDLNLYHDYVISANGQFTASSVLNQNYLTVDRFYTTTNEKNSLVLHPVREGWTQIVLFMKSGKRVINVNISARYPTEIKTVKKGIFTISPIETQRNEENDVNIDTTIEVSHSHVIVPEMLTPGNNNVKSKGYRIENDYGTPDLQNENVDETTIQDQDNSTIQKETIKNPSKTEENVDNSENAKNLEAE